MHQVVVMGDLNETLTASDRLPRPPPRPAAAAALAPIHALVADGFTDVWRHLHPNADLQPGFTCTRGRRTPRAAALTSSGARDSAMPQCSARASHIAERSTRAVGPLPAVRRPAAFARAARAMLHSAAAAAPAQPARRHGRAQGRLHQAPRPPWCCHLSPSSMRWPTATQPTQLARLRAHRLSHRAAFASFPITGAAPFQSRDIIALQRQLKPSRPSCAGPSALVARPGGCLTRSPEWIDQQTAAATRSACSGAVMAATHTRGWQRRAACLLARVVPSSRRSAACCATPVRRWTWAPQLQCTACSRATRCRHICCRWWTSMAL